MQVRRVAKESSGYSQTENAALNPKTGNQSDRVRQAELLIPHTWDGAVATTTLQNPVIEAEMPFYANIRFFPAKYTNFLAGTSFNGFHDLTTTWGTTIRDSALIHSYVSVGEDFTLGFFTGAPVAWRVPQEDEPASS